MADINISSLTKSLQSKNKEIRDLKSIHEKEVRMLKSENSKLIKNQLLLTNDDKYKEVIRMYAFGFSTGNIYKILTEEKSVDMTLTEVGRIVDKIDYLSPELHAYYIECKKEFKEKLKIDQGFFASAIYKKYQLLENEASESLTIAKEMGDEAMKLKCIDQLSKIYDKLSTSFFKNGIGSADTGSVDDLMNDYEEQIEQSEKIIEFDMNKSKVM